MTKQDTLQETIATLIDRRAEGVYWDFKRSHHKNNADLVHDVLCLANAKHRGSRFLIFGIDDRDFSLHSIDSDANRRTQAKIADLFRGNADKFFQSRFPEFYLKEITICGKLLDILVIEDSPYKPYYLVKRYEKIRAHHIYTRICDTNMAVDESAQPHEIERMWRERFGLDVSPLERAKIYLSDPDAWIPNNTEINFQVYHGIFPEFTLKVTNAEDNIACKEEWTRGETRTNNNHAAYYEICYHQTCLARIRYVSFDDNKKSMVAPNWKPCRAGRFYFYEADSIDYAVQLYHSIRHDEDHSKALFIAGEGKNSNQARLWWKGYYMEIPVLRTGELNEFLGPHSDRTFIDKRQNEAEEYESFLRNQLEFEKWRNGSG